MSKKSFAKKVICTSMIAIQCAAVVPHVQAYALTNLEEGGYANHNNASSIKIFGYEDNEDLKAKIIQDPEFIRNWANVAHSLGFGWCGGTANPNVGQGFEFKREVGAGGKVSYLLSARYNPNDPYASGYRAKDRLSMKISNVRFVIDNDSIKLGTPKVKKLAPLNSASFDLINESKTESKLSKTFNYTTSKTVSKTDNFKFGEKIGVKTSFKVGLEAIADSKVETSFEFNAKQGWSNTNSTTETKQESTTYTATVSPQTKKRLFLDVLGSQIDIPYEGKIYMEYDIKLMGFLKYTGNAREDHTEDRPTVKLKFGKNGMSAEEHLKDLYSHKNINGYSEWDWKWVDEKFGYLFKNSYDALTSRKLGGIIKGSFTNINGTKIVIREGKEIPLPDKKRRGKRSVDSLDARLQNEGIRIENIETQDVPGFRLNSITYNDKKLILINNI
uniref:Alpha-toxin n=1 Tax=Clostridium septicum TaxID=1504 RepID=B1PNB6_CLOSE|nr:alpha-toxin [Clostridium septicum]